MEGRQKYRVRCNDEKAEKVSMGRCIIFVVLAAARVVKLQRKLIRRGVVPCNGPLCVLKVCFPQWTWTTPRGCERCLLLAGSSALPVQ